MLLRLAAKLLPEGTKWSLVARLVLRALNHPRLLIRSLRPVYAVKFLRRLRDTEPSKLGWMMDATLGIQPPPRPIAGVAHVPDPQSITSVDEVAVSNLLLRLSLLP